MAQYVMQDLVDKKGLSDCFYIDSAATSREEIGERPHRGTRAKLKQMGIYCGDHRARQMTGSDYDKYDYIIGMDKWNRRNMLRILGGDPEGKVSLLLDYTDHPRDIADPWYTGNFDETFDDVDEGCRAMLKSLIDEGII